MISFEYRPRPVQYVILSSFGVHFQEIYPARSTQHEVVERDSLDKDITSAIRIRE
jgi:hypothetical protein